MDAASTAGSALTSVGDGPDPNLFDRLPDEIVSRILTIGCELLLASGPRYESSPYALAGGREPYLIPRPYPFIAKAISVCKRFHSIVTQNKSNSHLYHVVASPSSGRYDQNPRGLPDISFYIAMFHRTLELSRGCDIHLLLNLNDFIENDQHKYVGRRLMLHALKSAAPFMDQVISINVNAWETPTPMVEWVMQWLRTRLSFRRLQVFYFSASSDPPKGEFDTFLYDDGSADKVSNAYYRFPSLARVEQHFLPDVGSGLLLSFAQRLETLILVPNIVPGSSIFYDWPTVKSILTTCPNLGRVEVTLLNAIQVEPFSHQSHIPTSTVKQLVLEIDSVSFHALFHTISFPHLNEANILVRNNPPQGYFPLQQDDASFPSLASLSFFDASQHGINRLSELKAPKLDYLIVKSGPISNEFALEEKRAVRIVSPRRLVMVLDDIRPLLDQFTPFDLSKTERLELSINANDFPDSVGKWRDTFTGPVELLQLKELVLVGGCNFLEVVPWLKLHFVLPTKFKLGINYKHIFDMEQTLDDDSSGFTVLNLTIPEAEHFGIHFGCNFGILPQGRICNHLANQAVVCFDSLGSSTGVLPQADCSSPVFRTVESLTLAAPTSTPLSWIRYLAVGVIDGEKEKPPNPPFQSLKHLTVGRSKDASPEERATLVDELRSLVATREEKGIPLRGVKITWDAADGGVSEIVEILSRGGQLIQEAKAESEDGLQKS